MTGCPPQGDAFEGLEPDDGKLSRPVLRGERGGNAPDLPGPNKNGVSFMKPLLAKIPCPHCGSLFGLPSILEDTGDVTCPHCEQVSTRVPCLECKTPFVFIMTIRGFGEFECPHCHEVMFIMNGNDNQKLMCLAKNLTIKEILELGYSLESRGMTKFAIEEYEKVLVKEPDNFEAIFALGTAYSKRREFVKAEFYLKKAIGVNPDHAYSHRNLGILYGTIGKHDEMILEFKKSIELDPTLVREISEKIGYTPDQTIQLLEMAPPKVEQPSGASIDSFEISEKITQHNCNDKCEREAHEYAKRIEEENVKYKRFNAPPPRPGELIEGWQEQRQWIDDKTTADKVIKKLSDEINSTSIGAAFHYALEGARNRMVEFLGDEIPNWIRSVPICYSYTGEPNACVMNGPNDHPIIVIDYAFMVGLERITNLYMVSWDIILPYLTGTPNIKG